MASLDVFYLFTKYHDIVNREFTGEYTVSYLIGQPIGRFFGVYGNIALLYFAITYLMRFGKTISLWKKCGSIYPESRSFFTRYTIPKMRLNRWSAFSRQPMNLI